MPSSEELLKAARWPEEIASRVSAALKPGPALVALDFDNTLIVGDVGETLHYAMCEQFAYALDSAEFWGTLPPVVGAAELRAQWDTLSALPLADRATAARDAGFDVELVAVFARYFVNFGARKTFDWAATLFAGLTPDALRSVAASAFADELRRPVGVVRAETRDGIPLRMNRGIRRCAAADALLDTMRAANADLWVVSATNRWALEAIAPTLGLRPDRVLANSCVERGGVIAPERDGATTWHEGKVLAWNERHNRPPDIVVGDSVSDAPLMRIAQRLSILIDRGDPKLRAEAEERGWAVVTREQLARER